MPRSISWVLAVVAILLTHSLFAQTDPSHHPPGLDEWRGWYRDASTSDRAEWMAERMDSVAKSTKHPMVEGYQAVAHLMMADEAWNPVDKLTLFNRWKPVLEGAILSLPNNPDLALLRLGVQAHVPIILDYRSDMERDQEVVAEALSNDHWGDAPLYATFARDFLLYLKSL